MIIVTDLVKIYYSKTNITQVFALRNVNLDISKGEFISIIGDSGSGKTTLLNMLGAIDSPTSGIVEYEGVNISKLSEDMRARHRNQNTGFVFQHYYLEQNFTAIENVGVPLMIQGISKSDRLNRAKKIMDEYGILDKMDAFPSELSGGEMQRVALCRALISNPKYILADEPTGNLDSKTGAYVIGKFREIADSGITVIMVTHNKEHSSLCDRIITIQDGEIVNEEP